MMSSTLEQEIISGSKLRDSWCGSRRVRILELGSLVAGLCFYAWVLLRPGEATVMNAGGTRPEHNAVEDNNAELAGPIPGYIHYPRQYVARRGAPSAIDGNVFKTEWEHIPWSEPFVEIRGETDAPAGTSPRKSESTRMKMLWDDENLYVAVVMDIAAGDALVAEFTERNSPIFHKDSDFEVFVDPGGCCHGYKELEMNAINTVWNLMLDQPYMDGGHEFSGREHKPGEKDYWDVKGQKSATRITKGAVNSPTASAQWCAEIQLAHKDTLDRIPVEHTIPAVGKSWRINFSRVEKKGQVNWVWAPQVVWSPSDGRYVGQVNMHLPDAWGYVVFADDAGKLDGEEAARWRDSSWPARHAAAVLYYACRAFHAKESKYPESFEELQLASLVQGADFAPTVAVSIQDGCQGVATANGWQATISKDRLLQVAKTSTE